MKYKLLIGFLALGSFASCDYILKKDKEVAAPADMESKVVTGPDKDENGCVLSAGYRWSVIKNDCVRPVEEAYRLNSVEKVEDDSPIKSAFVIFSEDKAQAELYLPDTHSSILLKENGDDSYKNGVWSLHSDKGYSLKLNGELVYVGAQAIQQGQVTGDDNPEN